MDFEVFYNNAVKVDQEELPGEKAQFRMMPSIRPKVSWETIYESNPTPASVMILVYPNSEGKSEFVLIQRKEYNGAHSAQVSLPGGKLEANEDYIDAALREMEEEIGVDRETVEVLLELTKVWVAPSKFLVIPFIGVTNYTPEFVLDEYEVDEIIKVEMEQLLDDANVETVKVSSLYVKNLEVESFMFENKTVWGATAMILSEFKELVKQFDIINR